MYYKQFIPAYFASWIMISELGAFGLSFGGQIWSIKSLSGLSNLMFDLFRLVSLASHVLIDVNLALRPTCLKFAFCLIQFSIEIVSGSALF
jgi:hypothetical protein